ncbi:unnamed protein product [Moneuplotes crassus]|uniref:Uncharacterized protein n=1 Tax=Euplotes crassus TaxID=5936 RepID=A0AAD1UTD1_EUPCR|nr:unnamed protein product [Moneuplotes crassus]
MQQEKRFEMHVKKRDINRNNTTSNNQNISSWCLGYFPPNFIGDLKQTQMKMDPKSNKIYAVEEITQKKKNIKLGNIYEENVGTQTQHFEGQEIGGPNKNQVVMYYSNKLFYIIPLEKSYTFKKQLSHVEFLFQEELLNFSNDPEYAQTNLKHRKKANEVRKPEPI